MRGLWRLCLRECPVSIGRASTSQITSLLDHQHQIERPETESLAWCATRAGLSFSTSIFLAVVAGTQHGERATGRATSWDGPVCPGATLSVPLQQREKVPDTAARRTGQGSTASIYASLSLLAPPRFAVTRRLSASEAADIVDEMCPLPPWANIRASQPTRAPPSIRASPWGSEGHASIAADGQCGRAGPESVSSASPRRWLDVCERVPHAPDPIRRCCGITRGGPSIPAARHSVRVAKLQVLSLTLKEVACRCGEPDGCGPPDKCLTWLLPIGGRSTEFNSAAWCFAPRQDLLRCK